MAYGLLGLKPWEFQRYTVREFEDAVAGAYMRHTHLVDIVMRHALATGQWSKPVSFRDLTGREQPLPLDPRAVPDAEAAEEDAAQDATDQVKAMEAAIRATARVEIVDGGGPR